MLAPLAMTNIAGRADYLFYSSPKLELEESPLERCERELNEGIESGQSFEVYGEKFINNVTLDNWQSISSLADNPYNKVLVREMKHCNLYIISWRPYSGSHVHTHHNEGCWFKVIDEQSAGAHLVETRWDLNDAVTTHYARRGQCGFIHNDMGKHQVVNNTGDWVFSLHLYPRD